jgi:hypothetical protein
MSLTCVQSEGELIITLSRLGRGALDLDKTGLIRLGHDNIVLQRHILSVVVDKVFSQNRRGLGVEANQSVYILALWFQLGDSPVDALFACFSLLE